MTSNGYLISDDLIADDLTGDDQDNEANVLPSSAGRSTVSLCWCDVWRRRSTAFTQ